MKIAVSATSTSLDALVDPRFGRCAYFVIVDTDTMQYEVVPNLSLNASSGAEIQAAQTVATKDIKVLITGHVGPNAFQALSAAGIKIVIDAFGTVKEVIEKYKSGELKETDVPTVRGHFGMGMGGGRGGGRRQWGT